MDKGAPPTLIKVQSGVKFASFIILRKRAFMKNLQPIRKHTSKLTNPSVQVRRNGQCQKLKSRF